MMVYLDGPPYQKMMDQIELIIKNDIKLRINSLFPNKPQWEDTAPVRKILFSEFYRQ